MNSFGTPANDNANAILKSQLINIWDNLDDIKNYQHKVIKMIEYAKQHWMVTDFKNQALCVLEVTIHKIKQDDEEISKALVEKIKVLFNPQDFFNSLGNKSVEELEEYTKFVEKANNIIPDNWNQLWKQTK